MAGTRRGGGEGGGGKEGKEPSGRGSLNYGGEGARWARAEGSHKLTEIERES